MILLRKPKKLSADVENGTQQEADDALIKKHYRKLLLRIMWNVYMHNQWFWHSTTYRCIAASAAVVRKLPGVPQTALEMI